MFKSIEKKMREILPERMVDDLLKDVEDYQREPQESESHEIKSEPPTFTKETFFSKLKHSKSPSLEALMEGKQPRGEVEIG